MNQRAQIRLAAGASLPVALAVWYVVRTALPPIAAEPMLFALQLTGAALFLAFLPVIEAVAHERLMSPAIDPLAGKDSKRLIVNQRVLQNTLEQSLVFMPGLFLVAHYADLRAAAACAFLWVIGRWTFWIGYHIGPMWRGLGVFSLVLGLAMLCYGVGCFGYELAGWTGVAALIGPFIAIETYLFAVLRRPPE
ncbi:MAG: MAPEG family protein [Proteobacteria bacterium]|nr:MAPEG family protein [Pseudomonadota bacterium]